VTGGSICSTNPAVIKPPGAVLFVAYYTVFLVGVEWTAPGYIKRVWNLDALSGVSAFGLPIEQFLFAAAFGAYWSGVYDHFMWQRSARRHAGGRPMPRSLP